MGRTERVSTMVHILSNHPNQVFPLKFFMDKFGMAKSSISEDISIAKKVVQNLETGRIETIAGAAGGVTYIPDISDSETKLFLEDLCNKINDQGRVLAGGFLYTSDLMFDAEISGKIGKIFAKEFQGASADYVVTIETKGIPVALMTSKLLGLPLVVIRRESKISEGSTLSINYFSGSTDRIQKMSISKRAVIPGKKAIVIDDFMRAGGSVKGIQDMMLEFDVEIVGTGIVIATKEPQQKKVQSFVPLIYLGEVDENQRSIQISPNYSIL